MQNSMSCSEWTRKPGLNSQDSTRRSPKKSRLTGTRRSEKRSGRRIRPRRPHRIGKPVKSEAEKKLKTALDESRLLILGAQVLFGFLFQGVFQEAFEKLPFGAKVSNALGLLSISLAVSLLMAPSLHHQIAFKGESVPRAITNASRFAGFSLLPLTVGIGLAAAVVFQM